jgi:hypothetical protein
MTHNSQPSSIHSTITFFFFKMQLQFLVVFALISLLVQSSLLKRARDDNASSDMGNQRKKARETKPFDVGYNQTRIMWVEDFDALNALEDVLDSSENFSAARDVIMPIVEEWFFRMPFDTSFSAVSGASSVFGKLAEYCRRE